MTNHDTELLLMPEVRNALETHGIDHEVLPCPDELSDTAAFCDHYGVPLNQAANTIVVTSRKTEPAVQAICVVLGTSRLDVNKKVRELLGAKKASFADAELTMQLTGMQIGGVTPFGVRSGESGELPVYVDTAVLGQDHVIMGGGNRTSKLRLAPTELRKLPGVVVVEGLAALRGPEPA
ncbi:YbaK/EbsC family protein [Arthrobacter sp. HY1533]|uniref:YbaK/EbsC family protein n=1 Tax=Arthrobacter sp. HY1533 TaxID=2970919 RepID=UPI0022BA0CEA|nr:YbaK/EbsC family protein [Arthrobacter sp. HY1533]